MKKSFNGKVMESLVFEMLEMIYFFSNSYFCLKVPKTYWLRMWSWSGIP
jgi:hypothetical protein